LFGFEPGKMAKIFRKQSLKVSDQEKTRAAELTLRESIYPLCLVTILFFLWVTFEIAIDRR